MVNPNIAMTVNFAYKVHLPHPRGETGMPEHKEIRAVSDDARQKAAQCDKCFACLQPDGAPLCKVDHCVEEQVHFLACLNDLHCAYACKFGGKDYCTCPVRKEIYQRYKI